MEVYNTQKDHLIIREYGRNTQNLINHAKTIENPEERQLYVEKVVKLIISMYPHTRNVEDYRLKVWSHVLKMAGFELDVNLPDNLPDSRLKRKPDDMTYPTKSRRLRHYGRNIKTMIDKAKTMTDIEQQKEYVSIIGSYMKMSYKVWNRENVNDEVISEEFAKLSNGELLVHEGANLDMLSSVGKKKSNSGNSSRKTSGRYAKNNAKNNSKNNNSKNKNSKNKNSNNRSFKNARNKKR
jgi:hypothetical protein